MFLHAVFFCHLDQCLEVDVDVVFILSAGVVYKYSNLIYLRKRFVVAYVALMMLIVAMLDRLSLTVNAYDAVTHLKEIFGNSFSDALRRSCDKHFNIIVHNYKSRMKTSCLCGIKDCGAKI